MDIQQIKGNWSNMISSEDFSECLAEIKKIKEKYPDFGSIDQRYFDSPPDPNMNPNLRCETIKREC